eukprot:scaffold465308_cov21-Prasinocladus_malaysianus.AAC.1
MEGKRRTLSTYYATVTTCKGQVTPCKGHNIAKIAITSIIQSSVRNHKLPWIHGLVYDIGDGVLKKIDIDFTSVFKKYNHLYSLYQD